MPSINDWKRALITLQDEPFFDLIKNFLGKVQTPFHKPSIIDSLEKFLLNPETQERIFLLLDRNETSIAGFILQSGGIGFDDLHNYFREDYSLLRFRSVVENLQERLIIYQDEDGIYYVNPLLQKRLEEYTRADPVHTISMTGDTSSPWLSEDLFIAFLALLKEYPSLRKQNGELKKNSREAFRERLSADIDAEQILLLQETAELLGLTEDRGGETVLLKDPLDRFMALEPQERLTGLASGVAAGAWAESSPQTAYTAGRAVVETMLKSLKPDRGYETGGIIQQLTESLAADNHKFTSRRLTRAFFRLQQAGFLHEQDGYVQPAFPKAPETAQTPMILQPTFEILLPPDAGGAAKSFAAVFCRLVRFDRVSKYELEQGLFLASLRNQGAEEMLLPELEAISGGRLPQNVVMTVRGWMDEFRQIEISTGTVVKVAPEIIPVMEEQFAGFILQTLAPGVYFVRPEKLSPFLIKWKSLGYADPGEIRNLLSGPAHAVPFEYSPDLSVPVLQTAVEKPAADGPEQEEQRGRIREELTKHLDAFDLSPEQERELTAKIEKKLYLFEDQIDPGACRIGRIEARGIDFHAKIRIVEDVLDRRDDLLEIESPEVDGGTVLVFPLELEKTPGNPTLKALALPEERECVLKIRRASRIRKRKRSLFY